MQPQRTGRQSWKCRLEYFGRLTPFPPLFNQQSACSLHQGHMHAFPFQNKRTKYRKVPVFHVDKKAWRYYNCLNIKFNVAYGLQDQFFFYKFVLYTFIFYTFIFYNLIFYTLFFFIRSFFIRSFFIHFIFYRSHFYMVNFV